MAKDKKVKEAQERKKARTPEELGLYHAEKARCYLLLQEQREAKAKEAREKREACEAKKALEKESKDLLQQVKDDWPFLCIEDKRGFAYQIGESKIKEVMPES